MKFGIMSSQMNLLIPPGISSDQMLSHIASYTHADLINEIVDNGFDIIELSGDLGLLLPNFYSLESINQLVKFKANNNITYTVHLPLWSVELSTPLQQVRGGSISAIINHIKIVKPLEPETYVLHATGSLAAEFYQMKLPKPAKGFLLEQFKNNAKTSIVRLLEETGIPPRKLALETIEFPFETTLELVKELGVSICFDTGHVLAGFSGPVDFYDALIQSMPYIVEFHLHDSPEHSPGNPINYGKDHQSLGKGDLNIKKFLDLIILSGFTGPIILELSLEDARKSLIQIRKLRPTIFTN